MSPAEDVQSLHIGKKGNEMKTKNDAGITYLIIGLGLGLVSGFLLARSRAETWEELRRGASDGLDYLSRESEKVRTGTDEFVGKAKQWFGHIGDSLRAARRGWKANANGESPSFD
jgi:hypothetical protein